MKSRKQKRISLICAIVLLLTTIVPNLALLETFAATATVTYNGKATYGGSTVGNFTINGDQAFCIEHSKKTPSTGMAITSSIYDDENIAKCLYYGYAGVEPWSGFTSKSMGIVITSLALDYFYNNNSHSIANSFISYVNSQSLPKQYLTFSNSNLTAYKEENTQRTETVTLNGDSKYSISFALQEGVTLYNTTKGTTSTGTVTINGGDSFYLSTSLNSGISGTWISENISGSAYKFSSIIWTTSSENYQDLAQQGGFIIDPTTVINLSVEWLSTGGLTVEKTNDNGDTLSGVSFKIWNDSGYSTIETTDSNGTIVLEDLTSENYYIQEQSTVQGYILDTTTYSIEVKAGIDAGNNIKTISNSEPTR